MRRHSGSAITPSPSPSGGWRERAPGGLPDTSAILGRAGEENFPVALRALPLALRTDLLAVYGYARLVDHLGDVHPGDRITALDWVDAELTIALEDERAHPLVGAHPLVAAVATTVVARRIDAQPLRDLIAANRQDQVVTGYATFTDLLAYCRLSANPVGRLVLGVFGAATPERERWSDSVCTALQLAEHWQDVGEDAGAGRIYLPADDMDRFGIGPADIGSPPARAALRGLMAFEVARARRLLDDGAPLVASLRGWPRLAVAGFVAGGYAALDAVADAGFDPLGGPPRPTRRGIAGHAAAVLRPALTIRPLVPAGRSM